MRGGWSVVAWSVWVVLDMTTSISSCDRLRWCHAPAGAGVPPGALPVCAGYPDYGRFLRAVKCGDVGAQVIVGTRRGDDAGELLRIFGPARTTIDLDDSRYFAVEDLAAYAQATLPEPSQVEPQPCGTADCWFGSEHVIQVRRTHVRPRRLGDCTSWCTKLATSAPPQAARLDLKTEAYSANFDCGRSQTSLLVVGLARLFEPFFQLGASGSWPVLRSRPASRVSCSGLGRGAVSTMRRT